MAKLVDGLTGDRLGLRVVESTMRRLVCALIGGALTLGILSTVYAATITESDTNVRFSPGCDGTGLYTQWNRTLYPSVEESLLERSPQEIAWSAASPIDIVGGAGAVPGQQLAFLLFDANRTLLFEAEYDLVRGPDGVPYFRLDVTLDCSVVPYREILLSDTATAGPEQSGLPLLLGLIALTLGSLLAFRAGGRHLGRRRGG